VEYAIRTENLTKSYGKTFKASMGLAADKEGEVVGYVGPTGRKDHHHQDIDRPSSATSDTPM